MRGELYTQAPDLFRWWNFLLIIILGFFCVILQYTLVPKVGLSGYGPEWVLILSLYVALRSELWQALLMAFILGFIRDAAGSGILGLTQFSHVTIIWLFFHFRGRVNFFNPLALGLLLFTLALLTNAFIVTPIMTLLGWPLLSAAPISLFLVSSLATAIVGLPLFALLNFLTAPREKQ